MISFKSKNIRLRAVESEDLLNLLNWENNRENWEVSGTNKPFNKDLMCRYIQQAHLSIYEAGQYRFIIENIHNKEAIGTIDLFDFDAQHKRAGVGILIGNHKNRGKGYAKEALQILINYSFKSLTLKQLYCSVLEDNIASLKLFKNQGFGITGTKKSWIKRGDTYIDEIFMQLIPK